MPIHALDHVNLRTSRLDEMVAWYEDILGLKTGKRPDFKIPGAWIYIGDVPAIHLVDVAEAHDHANLKLEHFALSASGMGNFIALLKDRGIEHSIDPVPGFPIVQVNLRDVDGNHIHVDFDAAELEQLD